MNTPAAQLLNDRFKQTASQIREAAHELHASVNQHYDKVHPYSVHLDMVVDAMMRYVDTVIASDDDFLPIYFGAYFHDSIEDARLTYRDTLAIAKRYMSEPQAVMAAEIVYALTNEKGRTRAERANDRYYEGIRNTPYAPLVKLADRLANMTYSATHARSFKPTMLDTYRNELPHFLEAITVKEPTDGRFVLPAAMVEELQGLV